MSVDDFFHAALLVLRPDTHQSNRHQASQYLIEWVQKSEQSLGPLLQLIANVFCNPSAEHGLSQFELEGVKGLFVGLFYNRCKSGRYFSNNVQVGDVLSVIDGAILFEEQMVLSRLQSEDIFKMTLFGSRMCASRCAIAIHQFSNTNEHDPLSKLLQKCQIAIVESPTREQRLTTTNTSSYSSNIGLEVLLALSTELEIGSISMKQSDKLLHQCKSVVLNCVRHECVSQLQSDGSLIKRYSSTFANALKVLR